MPPEETVQALRAMQAITVVQILASSAICQVVHALQALCRTFSKSPARFEGSIN